jgi:simple sugar transport system permease protein
VPGWARGALAALAAVAVLVLTSTLTGQHELTSSGTAQAALRLSLPILLAGLGGLWAERAGVINIGLEGMMILGTWGGAFGGIVAGPWAAVLCGVIFGALGGLLHALATVTFGVNHIVSGVAITLLAAGLTKYLSTLTFQPLSRNPRQSPPLAGFDTYSVQPLGNWLGRVESGHRPVLADLAGLLRGLVTGFTPLVLLGLALVPVSYLLLWRTRFGLRLRSCGENPAAAESLGVNVYTYKYLGVIISGALAGLGGVFLAIGTHFYLAGQTGGRGYIGLAAMIFGNWRPGGLAMGAGLFGYADSLQLRNGGPSVHALLLLLAVLLVAMAAWRFYRGARLAPAIALGFAVLLTVWYLTTDTVADEVVQATPYLATLLVMALSAQRLRMPKADGLPYRKGQGS